jgi:nucleoid-associated protein YgaU
MVLNMKAAVMICAACIAGMSWFLHGVGPREMEIPSPLVAGETVPQIALAPVEEWAPPPEPTTWRTELAGRFERPSPVAQREDAIDAVPDMLPVADLEPVEQEVTAVGFLPPLPSSPDVEADASTDVVVAESEPELPETVVAEALPAEQPEWEPAVRRYLVVRGDTLTRIARRECGSRDYRLIKLLMALNPAVEERDGHVLRGERVFLPDPQTAEAMLAVLDENGRDLAGALAVARGDLGLSESAGERWYTIQRNDSLVSIARRYLDDAERWREILELNRQLRLKPNRIYPGVRIKLPPVVRVAQG